MAGEKKVKESSCIFEPKVKKKMAQTRCNCTRRLRVSVDNSKRKSEKKNARERKGETRRHDNRAESTCASRGAVHKKKQKQFSEVFSTHQDVHEAHCRSRICVWVCLCTRESLSLPLSFPLLLFLLFFPCSSAKHGAVRITQKDHTPRMRVCGSPIHNTEREEEK